MLKTKIISNGLTIFVESQIIRILFQSQFFPPAMKILLQVYQRVQLPLYSSVFIDSFFTATFGTVTAKIVAK